MATEPQPTHLERQCEAPACPRRAIYVAAGRDFDGEPFEDLVCQSCANYLTEASAELGDPVKLTSLRRVA